MGSKKWKNKLIYYLPWSKLQFCLHCRYDKIPWIEAKLKISSLHFVSYFKISSVALWYPYMQCRRHEVKQLCTFFKPSCQRIQGKQWEEMIWIVWASTKIERNTCSVFNQSAPMFTWKLANKTLSYTMPLSKNFSKSERGYPFLTTLNIL